MICMLECKSTFFSLIQNTLELDIRESGLMSQRHHLWSWTKSLTRRCLTIAICEMETIGPGYLKDLRRDSKQAKVMRAS